MTSQLAAQATLEFNDVIRDFLPNYVKRRPTFDARVWTVPNRTEAANYFLWREWDATKNSISMAAQSMYSHNELQGKNSSQLKDMMMAKGTNWNDYADFFKRGTYIQKIKVARPYYAEEIEKLPPLHEARTNLDLVVERNEFAIIHMPIFSSVTNRESVIFEGAEPITND